MRISALWNGWFGFFTAAAGCSIVLSSSCARSPIETFDEPTLDFKVDGAFTDWYSSTNSFSGGMFALLDAATAQVFTSEVKSNYFKLEKIPAQGRYYGLLLGPDFQVRGTLQKTSTDGTTNYYVFKLGQTQGHLGTLVVNSERLESSQQAELDFQTTFGASKEKKAFALEYSTNFAANPDIDGDGIPNVIDDNVDEDDFSNLIDNKTYGPNSISDSRIPWQHNYGYGIPKNGFFKCDQLKTPVAGTSKFTFEFWCSLKLPANTVEKVTLKSVGLNTDMFDDGGQAQPAHRDPTPNDGVWTSRFTLNGVTSTLFPRQLVMATATLKNGTINSYLTLLGPEFPYAIEFKVDPATNQPVITLNQNEIKAEFIVKNWAKNTTSTAKGVVAEILILDPDDQTFIKSFPMLLESSDPLAEGSPDSLFTFADTKIAELGLNKNSYRFKIRLIGPAALPGLVGSGAESAVTEPLPFPTP